MISLALLLNMDTHRKQQIRTNFDLRNSSDLLRLVSHYPNMLNTFIVPKESARTFVRLYGGRGYPMRHPDNSNRCEVKPNESRVIAVGCVVAVPHVRIIADQ